MKKIILIFLTLSICTTAFTQDLTYSSSDLGAVGDLFYTRELQLDTTDWIPADSIDPQMWNFSSLQPNQSGTIEIYSKNDFPELDTLPESTLVMQNQDNSYTCLNLENNYLYLLGMLMDMDGTLFPVLLDPAPEYLHFPLTIGEGGSETISHQIQGTPEDFNLSVPFHDSVRFDIQITASTMVEDTGTVTTLQYAYPAFKVSNATIFEVDLYGKPSIGSWYLMQDDVAVDSTKGLQFYTPEYGVPVVEVQMTWNNEIQSMRMIDEDPQSIVSIHQTNIDLYPNPIKAQQTLHFSQPLSDVAIFDMNGRLIIKRAKPVEQIKLPHLPEGVYILNSTNLVKPQKIVIQ
ncbi:MAG TPA: T9SS type A sorting domain-containing protein [Salinivirga sp.]|uniref:T9SS type A sorting domain-containing protein n=1 Tax=Salinivirga sp. TaxID=1970192 RepID=UPI002B47863C|nr:T9SS type A sorting domain-containing protein [Salinivirga sp.]HKK59952.1 T9SS type A sorting domain-containing protein [Salinivirga sp.]